MIFITTGTQFSFERLLRIMDKWASTHPEEKLIAQTGKTNYFAEHIKVYEYLTPAQYIEIVKKASILVGHAGSGTMITACQHNIPVILMPRRFDLQEHRSEHQLGMAEEFSKREGVYIAYTESELFDLLKQYKTLKPVIKEETPEKEMLVHF